LAYQGFAEFPKDRENESVIGNPSYYVFDIAFYNGVDLVQTKSTGERIDLLKNIFCMSPALQSDGHDIDWFNSHMYFDMALMKKFIGPIRYMSLSEITDLDLAKKMKIEGFVVVDLNARYGDRAYSFDGKAQRPEGIYKRKPLFDEEVIIGGYEIGSGRNGDKLGAIFIEQIHPKSGLRIKCGKVGTGFTNEQREMFWEQKENLIGKTIKIEFAARQAEKDGEFAFKFPVFKGFADKRPDECIAQHLENDDE
jgi:ATP-dependent DNA ligase